MSTSQHLKFQGVILMVPKILSKLSQTTVAYSLDQRKHHHFQIHLFIWLFVNVFCCIYGISYFVVYVWFIVLFILYYLCWCQYVYNCVSSSCKYVAMLLGCFICIICIIVSLKFNILFNSVLINLPFCKLLTIVGCIFVPQLLMLL